MLVKVKERVDAACDESDLDGIGMAIRDDEDESFYEGEESKIENTEVIKVEVEDKESVQEEKKSIESL